MVSMLDLCLWWSFTSETWQRCSKRKVSAQDCRRHRILSRPDRTLRWNKYIEHSDGRCGRRRRIHRKWTENVHLRCRQSERNGACNKNDAHRKSAKENPRVKPLHSRYAQSNHRSHSNRKTRNQLLKDLRSLPERSKNT